MILRAVINKLYSYRIEILLSVSFLNLLLLGHKHLPDKLKHGFEMGGAKVDGQSPPTQTQTAAQDDSEPLVLEGDSNQLNSQTEIDLTGPVVSVDDVPVPIDRVDAALGDYNPNPAHTGAAAQEPDRGLVPIDVIAGPDQETNIATLELENSLDPVEQAADEQLTTAPPVNRTTKSYTVISTCKKIEELNCMKVIEGDPTAVAQAKSWQLPSNWLKTTEGVTAHARSCDRLLNYLEFKLPLLPRNREETLFPLAYIIIVRRSLHQFIMTLRRLYWPQNAYCIHVDPGLPGELKTSVSSIVDCLPNTIAIDASLTGAPEKPSLLQPAYECLKRLDKIANHDWKYVQVLYEDDMPIRTNEEMIRIFRHLGGANDVDFTGISGVKASLPSFGATSGDLTVINGRFHAALSREFVRFALYTEIVQFFYKWCLNQANADNIFWPTLNFNPQFGMAPGGYSATCLDYMKRSLGQTKPSVARYEVLSHRDGECQGKWDNVTCVFGVGDLQHMIRAPQLLAHKFSDSYEPAALYCLDELLCSRMDHPKKTSATDDEGHALQDVAVSAEFYEQLPTVRFHKLKDKTNYKCKLN